MGAPARPVLALLPWGNTLEDFLAPNRLTLDEFCGDFVGSWMFGYAEALRQVGVDTVIVCVSSSVDRVTRRVHAATGTPISLVPAPRTYRILRSRMRSGYGRTVAHAFDGPRPARLALYPLLFLAKEIAPYLATPARTVAEELRHLGCSTVLCQEYEYPRFDVCVALARDRRTRVFATFQGGDYQRWRVERLVRPLAISRAAGLVIGSEREVERVRASYRPRAIAPIPNPIDLEAWRPHDRSAARRGLGIPEEARVVAWHGRVSLWKKGLDTLVDAWALVCGRPPDRELVLLLVGTGDDSPELRRRIDERGLHNVRWVDRYLHDRDEIGGLLAAADVYVFPSRHEGFPLAPLEAMACGLPVVATNVSGIRDVIPNEEAGGVLVPCDDAERLAEALNRLLADDSLSRDLAQRARSRAEAFAAENVGRRLRAFFFDGLPSATGGVT